MNAQIEAFKKYIEDNTTDSVLVTQEGETYHFAITSPTGRPSTVPTGYYRLWSKFLGPPYQSAYDISPTGQSDVEGIKYYNLTMFAKKYKENQPELLWSFLQSRTGDIVEMVTKTPGQYYEFTLHNQLGKPLQIEHSRLIRLFVEFEDSLRSEGFYGAYGVINPLETQGNGFMQLTFGYSTFSTTADK